MQATAETGFNKRSLEIAQIWKDNRWLYVIAGVLLGILITPAIEQITGHLNDLIGNLVPEAISVLFTILILERLTENREREAYKQELFRQAKSRSNDFAVDALRQIQDNNWWEELLLEHFPTYPIHQRTGAKYRVDLSAVQWAGIHLPSVDLNKVYLWEANLQEANLEQANLQRASLGFVNLQEAFLFNANLQGANLTKANLQEANLLIANLQEARLLFANLQGANLTKANLQEADLGTANLQGADLPGANLRGADLLDTKFNEKTVLPDAELVVDENGKYIYNKYWTPQTDMSRYTDPNHPDFWQPDWAKKQDD